MPVSVDNVITFDAYAVSIDVAVLLGLNVLRDLELITNLKDETLFNKYNKWREKLVWKMGHLYIEWPTLVYYAET